MEVPNSASAPHAVLFPYGAVGHVRPLMQFSRRLALVYGFKVTVVTTSYIYKKMFTDATRTEDSFRYIDLQEGFPESYYSGEAIKVLILAMNNTIGPLVKEVVGRIHREIQPITCVISDVLFVAPHKVAVHYGIPSVAFSCQCVMALSAKFFGLRLADEGLIPLPKPQANMGQEMKAVLEKVVTCIPGLYPIKLGDYHSSILTDDLSNPFFQWQTGECSTSLHERDWVLNNTFFELEAAVIEGFQQTSGIKLTTIGPLAISPMTTNGSFSIADEDNSKISLWPEETSCMEWLSKQTPVSVIYVSFGSLAMVTASVLQELLLGLEASQMPFLMVIRPDIMNSLGDSAAAQNSFKGFQERTKDRALFVSWAPQLRVLGHPAIAGFLTHCGWNSFMESISMGVPFLCYPFFVDQPMICKYMVNVWKIGLELNRRADGSLDRLDVAEKVRALAAKESSIRANAKAWKDIARGAVENGGSSHNNMLQFVADMYERAQVVKN